MWIYNVAHSSTMTVFYTSHYQYGPCFTFAKHASTNEITRETCTKWLSFFFKCYSDIYKSLEQSQVKIRHTSYRPLDGCYSANPPLTFMTTHASMRSPSVLRRRCVFATLASSSLSRSAMVLSFCFGTVCDMHVAGCGRAGGREIWDCVWRVFDDMSVVYVVLCVCDVNFVRLDF